MSILSYNELKELLEDFKSKGFENNILIEYIEDEITYRYYVIEKETAEEMRILSSSLNERKIGKIIDKYALEESIDSRKEEAYKLAMEALDKKKNKVLVLFFTSLSLVIILLVITVITGW